MKHQFVTFQISKKLQGLGFNDPCMAIYTQTGKGTEGQFERVDGDEISDNNSQPLIAAPLWQQVIEWLRVKYTIDIVLDPVAQFFAFHIYKNYQVIGAESDRNINKAREHVILKALELVTLKVPTLK